MIVGGAGESVGNQHFWLLLSETHEFCHCGANTAAMVTRARACPVPPARRPLDDKGEPEWKFVGDKKRLVIGRRHRRLRDIVRKRLYHNTHNWQAGRQAGR